MAFEITINDFEQRWYAPDYASNRTSHEPFEVLLRPISAGELEREQAKARIRAFAAEHGGFAPADVRDMLGTTRKWLIPFLEALDKSGFSRRVGDKRVVRES